jgi:hypothetical protein
MDSELWTELPPPFLRFSILPAERNDKHRYVTRIQAMTSTSDDQTTLGRYQPKESYTISVFPRIMLNSDKWGNNA